jgi:hypothetical protein
MSDSGDQYPRRFSFDRVDLDEPMPAGRVFTTRAAASSASEEQAAFWACRELGIPLRPFEAVSLYRWPHQTSKTPVSLVPAFEGSLLEDLDRRIGKTPTVEQVRNWVRAQAQIELHPDSRKAMKWIHSRRKALEEFRPPWCSVCDDHLRDTSRACRNCNSLAPVCSTARPSAERASAAPVVRKVRGKQVCAVCGHKVAREGDSFICWTCGRVLGTA